MNKVSKEISKYDYLIVLFSTLINIIFGGITTIVLEEYFSPFLESILLITLTRTNQNVFIIIFWFLFVGTASTGGLLGGMASGLFFWISLRSSRKNIFRYVFIHAILGSISWTLIYHVIFISTKINIPRTINNVIDVLSF